MPNGYSAPQGTIPPSGGSSTFSLNFYVFLLMFMNVRVLKVKFFLLMKPVWFDKFGDK